jgi:hypothetical protein
MIALERWDKTAGSSNKRRTAEAGKHAKAQPDANPVGDGKGDWVVIENSPSAQQPDAAKP